MVLYLFEALIQHFDKFTSNFRVVSTDNRGKSGVEREDLVLMAWHSVQDFCNPPPRRFVVGLAESFDRLLSPLVNLVEGLAFGQIPPESF